jgi:lipid-A-disaccharide synthase
MEPPIYAHYHVDARFVGHPLADAFALEPDQAAARQALGLAADVPVLALLPGSRLGEIRRLGQDFLDAAEILAGQIPNLHVVIPAANEQCYREIDKLLGASRAWDRWLGAGAYASPAGPRPTAQLLDGRAHEAMIAADAVLLASGTAALEAMLAKRPMVVAYRVARLTHWIVKTFGLLRTDVYSLPNILAGRTLVPELMQDACTPAALASALLPMLRERALAPALFAEFARLHEELRGDPSHNAAAAITDFVTGDSASDRG